MNSIEFCPLLNYFYSKLTANSNTSFSDLTEMLSDSSAGKKNV